MAYRYRDQVFRFLANGQSGRSTGQAPLSYRKVGAAIAIAAIIILLILLWLLAANGGFRRGGPRWDQLPESPASMHTGHGASYWLDQNGSTRCTGPLYDQFCYNPIRSSQSFTDEFHARTDRKSGGRRRCI